MKRHHTHSASCSCTSCVYRSRSKQPSIQQIIQDGSKIDRLYYGKYLPLRERKLLEKLIRTRAVYDDVRTQLLSTSGSSDQTRSEHKMKRRDADSTEKSSAVIKMVDLVDRGQMGSSNTSKLSSCCSCCSCGSLRKIKKHMEKHPPKVHRHQIPYESISRYTVEAEKRARMRRKRLSTKISSSIRAVRFKMKNIKSEPCTCTLTLSSIASRPSKAFMKKVRLKEMVESDQPQRIVTTDRKSLRQRICNCSCKMANCINSLKKIKGFRHSMTERYKDSGTDMAPQRRFKIKKDSLTLFREKIRRQRLYKDMACESGICVVDECIPEECLKNMKGRAVGEKRREKYHSRHSGTGSRRSHFSISTRTRKVRVSDSRVQIESKPVMGPVICECKPTTKSVSSMTTILKSKSLVDAESVTTELKTKKPKAHKHKIQEKSVSKYEERRPVTPKQQPEIQPKIKETTKQEKDRSGKEDVQVSPKSKLGHVICECKPTTKSVSSMTTIPQKRKIKSVSKSEIRMKRPVTPKRESETQPKIKETTKQEKDRFGKEVVQVSPKSKLGHVICECKPFTKSVSSMTAIPEKRKIKSVSKSEIRIKRPVTPKRRSEIQSKIEQTTKHEKIAKTDHSGQEVVQVSPKSKLGHVICECKPITRSVSSMTTILEKRKIKSVSKSEIRMKRLSETQPKIKETIKHKKDRSGKEDVQVLPKSKFGHVICECGPMTKSVSSMTRHPKLRTKHEKKYKTSRRRHKREPYRYKKEEELVPEPVIQAVKISSSFKFEIEFSKKKYPKLTDEEVTEHVKSKRANRTKQTQSKIKQHKAFRHSKTQFSGSATKASQDSYLRESASQASLPYRKAVLPFPRECEPSMCIPYECDPEDCARILLSKSKPRGRSTMSSTNRLRRKSVGSATFTPTSGKSKYIQSRSTESFIGRSKKPFKESVSQIIEKNTGAESSQSQKQAVRISSSFSFGIEFYKDESREVKTGEIKDMIHEPKKIRKKHTEYPKKYKDRSYGARSSRNVSSQSWSSQSLKNTQMGHRLKRCLCTLKLLQKKKQKQVMHVVSRKTMASLYGKEHEVTRVRQRQTQTKSSGIAYVVPPMTSTQTSLLPYECEPYFCTPGKCNPYECAERIKQRKRRHIRRYSKETSTISTPRRSTSAYTSRPPSGSVSRRIQSGDYRYKKHKVQQSHSSKMKSKVSSDKSVKQVVRLGSSFNFNIEFSKKINDQQIIPMKKGSYTSDMPKKKQKMQQKGIKVYKPRVRHPPTETSKLVTKQTDTEPFLHKCLCKLKLLKRNENKVETSPPRRNKNEYVTYGRNKSITAHRVDIRYNIQRPCSYECEPGIYPPQQYDRCKCKKCKKNYPNKYPNAGDLRSWSTLSDWSRTITSSKSQNAQSCASDPYTITRDKKKFHRDSKELKAKPSHSKQVVRVGSSYGINIEFSKKKKMSDDITMNSIIKRDNIHTHCNSIDAKEKHPDKRSYISTAIKRCFCSLRFLKKEKSTGLQDNNTVVSKSTKALYRLPKSQICKYQGKKYAGSQEHDDVNKKGTKLQICKRTSPQMNKSIKLRSHERPINVCIPGTCDPYECYEDTQRRRNKRCHANTGKQIRKSFTSTSTSMFSSGSRTRSTQSKCFQYTIKNDHKLKVMQHNNQSRRSISPPGEIVRIGSNLNFNIEFSKKHSMPSIQETLNRSRTDNCNPLCKLSAVNRIKGESLINNGVSRQVNSIKKEGRSSNIGFLLKRCFCRLGLQKNKIPKCDYYNNQPTAAQLVQVLRLDQLNPPFLGRNISKSRCSVFNNALYREQIKLSEKEKINLLQENIDGSQNITKKLCYEPPYLPKSNFFTKPTQFGFDFNDPQIKYLMNTHNISPFYQSFYALNVNVSNLKNVPLNTSRLKDKEPSVCIPCDPIECLKRIKNRLNRFKSSGTDEHIIQPDFQCNSTDSYKRQQTPRGHTTLGSDLKLRMDVYKDTDLYKNDVITKHPKPKLKYVRTEPAIKYKNEKNKKSGFLAQCLCPIVKKTETLIKNYHQPAAHNGKNQQNFDTSPKTVRVGSDISIDMSFFKGRKLRSDGITKTNSQLSKYDKEGDRQYYLQNTNSQVGYTNQNRGILHSLTKCLCTPAFANDNQNVTKPGYNVKATGKMKKNRKVNKPKGEKKVAKPDKSKKRREKTAMKYKSVKTENNKKSGKDKSTMPIKHMSYCVCPEYSKHKSILSFSKRRQSYKSMSKKLKDWSSYSNCILKKHQHYGCPDKRNVTFGSKVQLNYNVALYNDRSDRKNGCNLTNCKYLQGTGDGDDGEQYETYTNSTKKKKLKGKKSDKCQCKKNTKVNRGKDNKSVNSAATDGTIAKTRVIKFEECNPLDCEQNFETEMKNNVTIAKKKKKSKKPSNEKKSTLKKCFCALAMQKTQPECKQYEKGTCIDNKTNFHQFIDKCVCVLKEGSKQLRAKMSTARIPNCQDCATFPGPPKPALKIEIKKKHRKAGYEMETIMPYSKKKYTKLESRTKLAHSGTNTMDSYKCTCHTKGSEIDGIRITIDQRSSKMNAIEAIVGKQDPIIIGNKNFETNLSQDFITGGKQVRSEGQPVRKTKGKQTPKSKRKDKTKKKYQSDSYPSKCLCIERDIGDCKSIKNIKGLCPVCKARASGKIDSKINPYACTCMGDGKLVGKKYLQTSEKPGKASCILCPLCDKKMLKSNLKAQSKTKSKAAKIQKGVIKDQQVCLMSGISNVCSRFFNITPKSKGIDNKPLFEMIVNKNNNNIVNRDQVYKNLGTTGKQSKAMKKARKAIQKGNMDPPFMEMIIDKGSAKIVNSDDIIRQINYPNRGKAKKGALVKGKSFPIAETRNITRVPETNSERKAITHGSKCKCCICRKLKKGKQGTPKMKPRKLKPCICGSVICKKDWARLKKEERSIKTLKIKPCICGSAICGEESQKMPEILLEAARKAQHDKEEAKQMIIDEKSYQAARRLRKKQYHKEDMKLWKKRRREDRRQMRNVRKYDTANDILMVAESLTDLGSFGSKAFCDIMKSLCRVARHPRDGIYNVKDAYQHPGRFAKEAEKACRGMGLHSTLARIRTRIKKMFLLKTTVAKLESYPVTNYLVHLADRSPKHRLKRFKKRRLRAPLDFECSLFLASLRKRPCLRIYYMCPWFYPHCVSLLTVWKQFTDILLFILACGVWSPCILCMELCRALMCCCLCTG